MLPTSYELGALQKFSAWITKLEPCFTDASLAFRTPCCKSSRIADGPHRKTPISSFGCCSASLGKIRPQLGRPKYCWKPHPSSFTLESSTSPVWKRLTSIRQC